MATHVVMPQLGESVVEGTVGKWFKNVGDTIEQYESIMEVVTDKVTSEIPSPAGGTILQIIVPEGATVKAGTIVAIIGAPGEAVAAGGAAVQPPQAAAHEETRKPSNPPTQQRLTPVVARMIAEHNITDAELATIKGSGEGGRISKKDVEQFVAQRKTAPAPREIPAWEQPGTGELFRPTEEVFKKPSAPVPATPLRSAQDAREEIVPLSPMRRSIAEHMVRSKAIAPHVTSVHEVDMSRVIAYQKNHEQEFARQSVKLTYTAFLVQAAVAALKAFPMVNATYTEQGIIMKRDINVGVAVAIEDGLIVPVVKRADEKSLLGIARAVNDLATRARDKKLSPDDVAGGTFTITNFGIFGSLWGMPIIHQPQSAILGVGAIQKRPVVINDAIAIRPMCYLSITIDHRLLDGAIGDQFMQQLNRVLETYPE